jgi:hypothetical protein
MLSSTYLADKTSLVNNLMKQANALLDQFKYKDIKTNLKLALIEIEETDIEGSILHN